MIICLSTECERRIAIVSESYALVFKSISNSGSTKPVCNIELLQKDELKNKGFQKLTANEIFGFIGLIELDGLIFIGTIIGKSKVAQPIPNETVNKIHSIEFYCLNDPTWDFVQMDQNGYPIQYDKDATEFQDGLPRDPCFELRKLLSNGSFYYSSDFDLTSTLQHRGYGAHSLSADTYEEEYMWNSFLMKEVIHFRNRLDSTTRNILDDDGFLTTVICGFTETFITSLDNTKVALTIISKQSWKRAGTRFNARGVDDDTNVANFVETELIMYSLHHCYAFTQIRGSVPVFWEQETSMINPKVKVMRSVEATQPVFDEHFSRLINKYGPVNVVNLLADKPAEIELSARYREHLTLSQKLKLEEDVLYTEFDFHKETSGEGFSSVKKIIPRILESMSTSGYFSYDVKANKVLSEQHGIFRTNCLDCLDRTNVVQQAIGQASYVSFLEDFRLINPNSNIEDSDFLSKLNALWADHGDQISQIYTGTNALKSSYSRKGKMSFAGLLSDATKSVSRIYINTFVDSGKQQSIDFLLGRLPQQKTVELFDPMSQYISTELLNQEAKFTSVSHVNIFAGTFNVNGSTTDTDLSSWLYPIGQKFQPDIVVLGFQEVIELSPSSILNADYSKGSFWECAVNKCLNQYDNKYLLLRVEQVTSLLILVFARSDKAKDVKEVEGASKKTGFRGLAGNKGAVSIRFSYGESSFCFINSHFSAGYNNIDERRDDYHNILRNICFTRSKTILHHDSVFWMGDLNYRVNLANDLVRYELKHMKEGYIEGLLNYDQLTKEFLSGAVFEDFVEPRINFHPTYKYDNGTNIYDSSEKARTPSWTDRILYKGSSITSLAYSDVQLLLSDHRPVYAAYRVDVKFVNEQAKIKLMEELYENYKEENAELFITRSFAKINSDILLTNFKSQNNETSILKITDSSSNIQSKEFNPTNQSNYSRAVLRPPPPFTSIPIQTTPAKVGKNLNTNANNEKENKNTANPLLKIGKPLPPGFGEEVLSPQNANKDSNNGVNYKYL